jgi:hypothetical protein
MEKSLILNTRKIQSARWRLVDCFRLADNPDKVGQRRASGTSLVVLIDALASDLQALFRFRNLQDARAQRGRLVGTDGSCR